MTVASLARLAGLTAYTQIPARIEELQKLCDTVVLRRKEDVVLNLFRRGSVASGQRQVYGLTSWMQRGSPSNPAGELRKHQA